MIHALNGQMYGACVYIIMNEWNVIKCFKITYISYRVFIYLLINKPYFVEKKKKQKKKHQHVHNINITPIYHWMMFRSLYSFTQGL
jgi:hypothetical protein